MRVRYWPLGVPRIETVEAFVRAFETLGYQLTDEPGHEKTYERIVIYALGGRPKHTARQLEDGKWTSKLGDAEDIEHALTGLDGGIYGSPVKFMRRPRAVFLSAPRTPGAA